MIERIEALDAARAATLAEIHRKAFEGTSRGWSAAEIADLAVRGVVLADPDNCGFAAISIAADEAELLTLAVSPAARRRGLGERLLNSSMEAASAMGAISMFLEVAADNTRADALYRKLRFEIIGRRPRYYVRAKGRVDAIIMSRTL